MLFFLYRVDLARVLVLLHTLGPGLASLTICIAYGSTDEHVGFSYCFAFGFDFILDAGKKPHGYDGGYIVGSFACT